MRADRVAAWLQSCQHVVTANQLSCCQRDLLNYVQRERRAVTITRHGRALARLAPLAQPLASDSVQGYTGTPS